MLKKTVLQGKFLQLYFACSFTNCTHLDPAKFAATGCSTHSGQVPALRCVTHRTAMLNGTVVAFFDVSPLSPTAGLNPIDQRNGLLQAPAGTALVLRTCGQQQHSRAQQAAVTRDCVGMQHAKRKEKKKTRGWHAGTAMAPEVPGQACLLLAATTQ